MPFTQPPFFPSKLECLLMSHQNTFALKRHLYAEAESKIPKLPKSGKFYVGLPKWEWKAGFLSGVAYLFCLIHTKGILTELVEEGLQDLMKKYREKRK